MPRLRIPLWTFMTVVAFVAVGFGSLKNPTAMVASTVFTLTVVLYGVAVLVAVATSGKKRLAWLSFALFGGMTLFMECINPASPSGYRNRPILITEWLDYGLSAVQIRMLGMTCDGNLMERYYQVGQALGSTLVGFLASLLTLVVTAFRRTPATQ